jgi:hypothetical protein
MLSDTLCRAQWTAILFADIRCFLLSAVGFAVRVKCQLGQVTWQSTPWGRAAPPPIGGWESHGHDARRGSPHTPSLRLAPSAAAISA